jgi:16S rRNA (cytosine1402-N4)-methyltransferase
VPSYHRSVLEREVVELLIQDPEAVYLDATLGGGGHAQSLVKGLGRGGTLIGLDRDPEAIAHCRELFSTDSRVQLHLAPFSRLSEYCLPGTLSGALFDLGVSSHQLDDRTRGFSFEPGTPLDMRMGPDAEVTALEWLQEISEEALADCFRKYADLEKPRFLARRVKELLQTTLSEQGSAPIPPDSEILRQAVSEVYRPQSADRNRLLARVFQAIRMGVNRETTEIRQGLSAAVAALARGGRICVLSYHSVEDREVKETFRDFEKDCVCPKELPVCRCGGNNRLLRKVVPKPLTPSQREVAENPRARSAKLRVMEKT